jgi:hypothetical protein
VDFGNYGALLAGLIAKQVSAVRGVLVAENYDATGTDRQARWMAIVICGHVANSSGMDLRFARWPTFQATTVTRFSVG